MWSIIIGVLTVCTQTTETVRICWAHYTDPDQLTAIWHDYQRFQTNITVYTDGRL